MRRGREREREREEEREREREGKGARQGKAHPQVLALTRLLSPLALIGVRSFFAGSQAQAMVTRNQLDGLDDPESQVVHDERSQLVRGRKERKQEVVV